MTPSYTCKLLAASLCFTVSVIYLVSVTTNSNLIEKSLHISSFVLNTKGSKQLLQNTTICIATIMYTKRGDKSLREEADVLIKSIVVSIVMYDITNSVDFHFVLSNKDDGKFFQSKIKEYNKLLGKSQLTLYVYSADDAISKYYSRGMTDGEKYKGQYLRIFLPKILEKIDSVIYLDSDIIISGNAQDLWNKFIEMNSVQIVAMGPDITAENPRNNTWFADIPYAPPKGLNSGVMLMNLTRMRDYGWTNKCVQLFSDYVLMKRIKIRNDQRLINVLLHYSPAIFLELPCHFNFWYVHCRQGFYCDAALANEHGIQVLHGASGGFNNKNSFSNVFRAYKNFDLDIQSNKSDIIERLMTPIRNMFAGASGEKNCSCESAPRNCREAIAQLLFKKVLDDVATHL